MIWQKTSEQEHNMSVSGAKPEWLAQFEGIVDSLNEGVLIVDDCNRILFANDGIAQMSGYSVEQIVGRTPAHFYSGEDLEFLNQQIARGEAQGRNRFEFHVARPAGERVPVVVSSRVIEDPEGRRFAVVTFTDITAQKIAEQQLREANARLEERQREIEAELALASRVQQSLAPRALKWGCVNVETHYMPVHTIGGDFGLVSPGDDGKLNLLVCDVSGHGIGSALVANRIYTETISLLERSANLDEILRRLNHLVLTQIRMSGLFFTLAAAQIGADSRRLRFAAAGHPPGILISASGKSRLLEAQSTVLGFFEEAVSQDPSVEVELTPGDRLVLYTDGLMEVFDERGEMLGVPGLQGIVERVAKQPLPQMKQSILDSVDAWRQGPSNDDISLVLVEFN